MLVCFWEKKQSFWKKVTVFLDKTYLQWKNKTKQKTSYSTELLIEMVNYLMIQIFTPQLKKKNIVTYTPFISAANLFVN